MALLRRSRAWFGRVTRELSIAAGLVPLLFTAAAADDDKAQAGEWIVALIILLIACGLGLIGVVAQHRARNPHTKLPRPIRRRRLRGPMRRIR